uniref:Ig-like domain-containing protein n=1 Tax=Anopheles atroparvus TaxID=41427 RepID=A0A182IPB4_ANOAO
MAFSALLCPVLEANLVAGVPHIRAFLRIVLRMVDCGCDSSDGLHRFQFKPREGALQQLPKSICRAVCPCGLGVGQSQMLCLLLCIVPFQEQEAEGMERIESTEQTVDRTERATFKLKSSCARSLSGPEKELSGVDPKLPPNVEGQMSLNITSTPFTSGPAGPEVCTFQPDFAEPIVNISVAIGRDATFTCHVRHLGGYRVGWLKADTKAIQAIHEHVITHNPRVTVSHADQNTWNLHIKSVTEEDRGGYMCQLNTDPMKSQYNTGGGELVSRHSAGSAQGRFETSVFSGCFGINIVPRWHANSSSWSQKGKDDEAQRGGQEEWENLSYAARAKPLPLPAPRKGCLAAVGPARPCPARATTSLCPRRSNNDAALQRRCRCLTPRNASVLGQSWSGRTQYEEKGDEKRKQNGKPMIGLADHRRSLRFRLELSAKIFSGRRDTRSTSVCSHLGARRSKEAHSKDINSN